MEHCSLQSLCGHMGIELHLMCSYHPQANGQVERMNREVEEALRHFVRPAHDDRDKYHTLSSATTIQEEKAPDALYSRFNRITPPLSPKALVFNLLMAQRPAPGILHRIYFHLAKQARSLSKHSIWSNSVHSDFGKQIEAGNHVLLSTSKIALLHTSLRRSFAARRVGPCRVTELVGRTAARIPTSKHSAKTMVA